MADATGTIARDIGSEAFWRAHFPNLHIGQLLSQELREKTLDAPPRNSLALNVERMKVDGYFQDRDDTVARLAPILGDAVRTCNRIDIPPAFIFLFDEAWECFYALHQHLTPFLGDYQILPDFWAWHVDPKASESGWSPHRDKGYGALDVNGNPLSLTVWIPLSEATPLSSCMYVLPKSRDPVYGTPEDKNWKIDYPSIRALPGKPGDFFCWDQAVLHWGSASSPFANGPRISMALEFQRTDAAPFNKPLLPAFCNLDFKSRLWLVGKQIMQYRHMYKVRPEFEALATSLLKVGQGTA
ncbi:phytanoyl-CoA dioxygenase family protein [Sphingomonas sp. M1-B02]|uniref:phytanoyl-CoA dioxygenase family protein n=1 Tax=Sphingomonas sp. M1-B02 TaxID=3114300 RepID=UPI00223FE1AC|nr:phytanoyl-CoA dioxygenase family protein [Sphingomonas sp. S6-11]UZK67205.1 phytanoyl-CoA dioxygenase family protein [Sphingomonas sp. S6-11]